MPAPWETVMAGLTGTRLRLYDEAEACGRADPRTDEELAAAAWLIEHRLARTSEMDGYLETTPVPTARQIWERHGPANRPSVATAAPVPAAVPTAQPEPAPRAAPVHSHQPDLFADERL